MSSVNRSAERPSFFKGFSLQAAAGMAATAALGFFAFFYFMGRQPEVEVFEVQPASVADLTAADATDRVAALAQDVALCAAASLPTVALFGAAAQLFREDRKRAMDSALGAGKKDAGLLLDALQGSDKKPPCVAPFCLAAEPQCVDIRSLERFIQRDLLQGREGLAVSEEEAARHGNKHANLVQMERIDRALDLEGLEIPLPHGIASNDVRSFLQKRVPEVFAHWEALGRLYAAREGGAPFLATLEAEAHLKEIERLIKSAFSDGQDLGEIGAPIEWLEQRQKANDPLMVRSTGAEDSKQTANAGGNLSRSYVRAQPQAVMEAVGDVVASYFSAGSLQNRIDTGTNPFQEDLRLSVTLQKLIGEPIGGSKNPAKIPTSFVLFTTEPLYYMEGEAFRVMRISASYGHGDGVVNSLGIATDTIFLLHSVEHPDRLYVIYDNQPKPVRLAPVKQGENVALEPVDNPQQLITRPALSREQLAQIYRSAIVMESFSSEPPADIEGVALGGEIYFVQTRPVTREALAPTYLKDVDGAVEELQAEGLVPGKASAIVITKPEDILVAETLDEAQRISLARGITSYRLVVVSRPEPQNSHAVVNFSRLGISCLYTSDLSALRRMVDRIDEKHPLAVCMQTAKIYLWDQDGKPVQESIKEGFIVHPARIAASLPIRDNIEVVAQPSDVWKKLFRKLQNAPFCEKLVVLAEISENLQLLEREIGRLDRALQSGSCGLEAKQRLEILKELYKHLIGMVSQVRSQLQKNGNVSEKLFYLKALETAFLGKEKQTGVAQYSLLHTSSMIRSIDLLIEYQNEVGSATQCADLFLFAVDRPVTEEAFLRWRAFLQDVEQALHGGDISKEELRQFKEIIGVLQKTGTFSQWLTFFFPQKSIFSLFRSGVSQQFHQILEEFTPADLTLIRQYEDLQKTCDRQRQVIERFTSAKSYEIAWKDLRKLIETVSAPNWLAQLQKASPTTKAVGYKVMQQALTLLDDSVKQVKLSDFEGWGIDVACKKMLLVYFELMKNWADIIPRFETHHQNWPLSSYLSYIEERLKAINPYEWGSNNRLLQPSLEFSVAAAVWHAGTAFERHLPGTLEDMLTLLHQNSLNWLSSLNHELIPTSAIQEAALPEALKQALHTIENTEENTDLGRIRVIQMGIEINENTVIVHYNVPLRNHSGQLDLIYDIRSSSYTLQGKLLGQARNRWSEIYAMEQIIEHSNLVQVNVPAINGYQELIFSWKISSDRLPFLLQEYVAMARYSLAQNLRYSQSSREFFNSCFDRWDSHFPVYEAASLTVRDLYKEDPISSLRLVHFLMQERGQFVPEALQTVLVAIKTSEDNAVLNLAWELLSHLISKKQGIKECLQAAQDLSSKRSDRAVKLLRYIINEKQNLSEVLYILNQEPFINPKYVPLQINVIDAFIDLVPHYAESYQAAIQAVQTATSDVPYLHHYPKDQLQIKRLKLLTLLVEKGQGCAEALQILHQEKIQDFPSSEINELLFNLFSKLVQQGYGQKEALQFLEKSDPENSNMQSERLRLLIELVNKKEGIGTALQCVQKYLEKDVFFLEHQMPYNIKYKLHPLLVLLVEEGQGYQEALKLVRIFSDPKLDVHLVSVRLELLKALVQKGQGIDEAKKIAEQSLSAKNSDDDSEGTKWVREETKKTARELLQLIEER